jgi:predicted acylesterase/phospholipase RssA
MPINTVPTRCCDLVMKGGITSGVLYPPAIGRISESYYLVGIGGTSAGAIAASVAAAAEYRRRQFDDNSGFEELEKLPNELAGEGKLTGLFRPDKSTRKVYKLFLDFLTQEERSWLGRLWIKLRGIWSLVRLNKRLKPVVENGFGLCTGMANGNRPQEGEIAPLTEWLAAQIDTVSGIQGNKPLTFGDLWQAPIPPAIADTMKGNETKSIDFRAVTTCVSFGRPYELPFTEKIFAFDVEEWKRYFPKKIIDYLVEEANKVESTTLKRDGKLPFPMGDAMPVVVAARMSLSFPGLFSMIPLYAINYDAEKQADDQYPMMKVWFSDGGVTSNLPIHRFDSLFPRWPTLGINLQYTDKEGKPARTVVDDSLIYMIKRRSDSARDLWNVFDGKGSSTKDMFGFLGGLFSSAQNWHDNSFLRLPSFRDRIVEIWLKEDEGGLNLAMPEETIKRLIDRGNQAGIKLRDRFVKTPSNEALSWDGHRWARLRSGLSGLSVFLRQFSHNVEHPMQGDRKLDEFLSGQDVPPAYKFESPQQLADAKSAIDELLIYLKNIESMQVCEGKLDKPFCEGPLPAVQIGTRAPM